MAILILSFPSFKDNHQCAEDSVAPNGRRLTRTCEPPTIRSPYGSANGSVIHVGHDVDTLAKWLTRFDPHYLLSYPSIAEPLLERVEFVRGGCNPARSDWQVRGIHVPARLIGDA